MLHSSVGVVDDVSFLGTQCPLAWGRAAVAASNGSRRDLTLSCHCAHVGPDKSPSVIEV